MWLFLGGFLSGCSWNSDPTAYAVINEKRFQLEVANTAQEREQGLAGRESLSSDKGMIFVYHQPQRPSFWMKGMRIPIDIIWIDGEKIVGFEQHLLPPEEGVKEEERAVQGLTCQLEGKPRRGR